MGAVIRLLLLLLLASCGSLDNADLSGTSAEIKLILQNPDESASGTAKAVDGGAEVYRSVAKAASGLSVTSCAITCGSISKTVSFASGTAQVSTTVDCTTGSITVTCADSDKTSNGVQFGFTGSATVSTATSSTVTITGRFLNQATRSSGDCRYCKIARDNNTQVFVECGFDSTLTDAQKTTARFNLEINAGNIASSCSTVDTSSDGLQATRGTIYIRADGGLTAPSCFLYNTSDAKQLKGTGSLVTDGDGNHKIRCAFGNTQWTEVVGDGDFQFRYCASCSKDGSNFVLLPSTSNAQGKIDGVTSTDVASLTADAGSCSSANNCDSGLCTTGNSLCAAVPAPTLANDVTTLAGPTPCDGACATGATNGPGSDSRFNRPQGSCLSANGNNLYTLDSTNTLIRRINLTLASTNSSFVTTLAGTSAGSANGACTTEAAFGSPRGCVVNQDNDTLYVTDTLNDDIRSITLTGTCTVSRFAGSAGTAGFTNGTGTGATFDNPTGLAIDSNGTLYIVDEGNNAVRRATSGAVVTTFAGGCAGSNNGTGTAACFQSPLFVALDSTETFLYVTDPGNNAIRRINVATQEVTTTASSITTIFGLTLDPTDTFLYVAANETIQRVSVATGTTTTLAGSAGTTGSNNGNGSSARFNSPQLPVVNLTGSSLFVVDQENSGLRQIQ